MASDKARIRLFFKRSKKAILQPQHALAYFRFIKRMGMTATHVFKGFRNSGKKTKTVMFIFVNKSLFDVSWHRLISAQFPHHILIRIVSHLFVRKFKIKLMC